MALLFVNQTVDSVGDSLRMPTSVSNTTYTMSRFDLPGLNLPLNFTPSKKLFRTALNDVDVTEDYVSMSMTTLRELTMLQLMNSITDKEGWEDKVLDETIAEKWKAEAMATEGRDVSQKMADWVIAELRFKAMIFKKHGVISVFRGDVVKSDNAIPPELKDALKAAVLKFEADQGNFKDYHPGSDEKVVDLVHPSLFPLIYGRSRVLKDALIGVDECIESCGKGVVVPIRPDEETVLYSSGGGVHLDNPQITSYINNLHPRSYQDLYTLIENVITATIPLWNHTLTPLTGAETWYSKLERINYQDVLFDPATEDIPEDQHPPRELGESETDYEERMWTWQAEVKQAIQPEPEEFKPPTDEKLKEDEANLFNLLETYADRGLQVIVKLANIELTPEKPNYEGGSWHVEGQLNEHICATALYYYDVENISPSHLAFRQRCADETQDMGYPQNEDQWLTQIFGFDANGSTVQEVGSVLCREGRLLTFPNVLQHQVQPFELADKTKKGHRKILALFLVDPGIKIISTANVAPQQKDWWSDVVLGDASKTAHGIGKLSNELKRQIVDDVDDFPIGLKEAKEIRLKLMEERKRYVIGNVATFMNSEFSLCEH